MTQVTVLDITELKTVRCDQGGPILRFVNSKLSWYQANSTSTATADDDLVVAPNLGTGRWFKQYSSFVVGLTPETITTNHNAVIGRMYTVEGSGSASITITLPATAIAGAVIGFYTRINISPTFPLIINLNGRQLNGTSTNRRIIQNAAYFEIRYVNDTVGWVLVISQPEKALIDVATSHLAVYSGNPYDYNNSIMRYLGTQKNTVSYQTPESVANGRTARVGVRVSGETGGIAGTGIFPLTTSADNNIGATWQVNPIWQPPLLIEFLGAGSGIRIDAFAWGISNSRIASRPNGVIIFGANTQINTRFNNNAPSNTFNSLGSSDYEYLTAFSDLEQIWTSGRNQSNFLADFIYNGVSYHTKVVENIGSTKFYKYIIVTIFRDSGTFQQYTFWQHLDFWGDVLTF